MGEPGDRELVILARQGDKEAFGLLIERYRTLAERVALRMVGAADTAQDLAQEAVLQAYLSLGELQKEDSFRSWLYGIVMNLSKNYLRKQNQRQMDLELDEEHPGNSADDPQLAALENELHRLVLEAVKDLPSTHQETALLYYYESLTLPEVAAITGASEGAVKVRLHRARNHLREKLRRAYPEIEPGLKKSLRRKIMVRVNIIDIVRREGNFVVILQGEAQEKFLPIWIGPFESEAIALGLRAYPVPRPQTFDFIVHLLNAFGAQLQEVRVEVLKDNIFYGIAKLRLGDMVKEVDARPSDVLALAVRIGCPIYVADEIMQQTSIGREVLEKDYGPIHSGQGVGEILKEREEALKAIQLKLQAQAEKKAGETEK